MSKHTPGPWQTSNNMRGIFNAPVHGVETVKGEGIANCGTGNTGRNNARLIAAAPDMAEALHALLACDFGARGWDDDAEKAAMKARAAISKATGDKA